MRVVLNGDGLLHVVLAYVLVHLFYSQWLPVLGDTTTAWWADGLLGLSLCEFGLESFTKQFVKNVTLRFTKCALNILLYYKYLPSPIKQINASMLLLFLMLFRINNGVSCPVTYFIISKQPETGGLVVFIICDVQVICSSLKDGIFTPRLCFGFSFYHFTGVQGRLDRGKKCKVVIGLTITDIRSHSKLYTATLWAVYLICFQQATLLIFCKDSIKDNKS